MNVLAALSPFEIGERTDHSVRGVLKLPRRVFFLFVDK